MADLLRLHMNRDWGRAEMGRFQSAARMFPLEARIFYAEMAGIGVQLVRDQLMDKVYNTPLPRGSSWGTNPSPRTGRTLIAAKGTSSALEARVYIDKRLFPKFFYPEVLEQGRRASPKYYGRWFFKRAMEQMRPIYFEASGRMFFDWMRRRMSM